jgi:hypothetical protein
MDIAAERGQQAEAGAVAVSPPARSRVGTAFSAFAKACQNALDYLPRQLDFQARPWKEREVARHFEAPWRKKLRRAVNFACIITLVSAAMMAALLLPEAESIEKQTLPDTADLRVAPPAVEMTGTTPAPTLSLASLDTGEWTPVRRPVQIFNLEGPETEGSDLTYTVNMRGRSARQDVMSWTPRAERIGTRPRIALLIERFEGTQPTQRPLFADIAARAAEHHIALDRMSEPAEIRTKFGAMQVADAQFAIDGQAQGCLVFRRLDTGGLVIAGWFCPPRNRTIDRVGLACFINRLDLVAAGTDRELRRHFAEAERQRGTCASARQAGRKITWLDHEAPVPPLKLSTRAR